MGDLSLYCPPGRRKSCELRGLCTVVDAIPHRVVILLPDVKLTVLIVYKALAVQLVKVDDIPEGNDTSR